MANPMMEPLEPYRPDSTYEETQENDYNWAYEDEARDREPLNIIWGRVAILGGIVLLAFLLGRMTSGGGDVSAADFQQARDRVQALEAENAQIATELESTRAERDRALADLEAVQAAPVDSNEQDTTAPAEEGSTEITGQEYTIKSGDTLTTIAEKFYGDASLDDYLAEVNNISDPTALSVGQKLIIPDDPPKQ